MPYSTWVTKSTSDTVAAADVNQLATNVDYVYRYPKGACGISLTNYSTTSVPAIAAGSYVEIASSFYDASTEHAISTTGVASTSDCTWFIALTPGVSSFTAAFSTVYPAWRDDYQGWYASTASNVRYAPYAVLKSTVAVYNVKTGVFGPNRFSQSAVSVVLSSIVLSTTSATKLTGYTSSYNIFNEWSTVNNRFTALESGYYYVSAAVCCTNPAPYLSCQIWKNGSIYQVLAGWTLINNAVSKFIPLNSGDYIEIYSINSGSTSISTGSNVEIFRIA